jgi:hypothetical protein
MRDSPPINSSERRENSSDSWRSLHGSRLYVTDVRAPVGAGVFRWDRPSTPQTGGVSKTENPVAALWTFPPTREGAFDGAPQLNHLRFGLDQRRSSVLFFLHRHPFRAAGPRGLLPDRPRAPPHALCRLRSRESCGLSEEFVRAAGAVPAQWEPVYTFPMPSIPQGGGVAYGDIHFSSSFPVVQTACHRRGPSAALWRYVTCLECLANAPADPRIAARRAQILEDNNQRSNAS